jgi:predicted dehydrogenase
MPKLKVAIVGCGNIAGGFDNSRDIGKELPYSHVGAYQRHNEFEVVACIDTNSVKAVEFQERWNIKNKYLSLTQLVKSSIDVISICSPTECHYQHLLEAIELHPTLIFCEKPITKNKQETEHIVELCEKNKILLAVNYSRCWDPKIQAIKEAIGNKEYGELRSITAFYSKGLFNNGSHLVNLFQYLLGKINILYVGRKYYDYFSDDPTCSFVVEDTDGIEVQVSSGNSQDYSNLEMCLNFSKKQLSMINGGLNWQLRSTGNSKEFSGYKVLSEPVIESGTYAECMKAAVENIYQTLQGNERLTVDIYSAVRTQNLCQEIITFRAET